MEINDGSHDRGTRIKPWRMEFDNDKLVIEQKQAGKTTRWQKHTIMSPDLGIFQAGITSDEDTISAEQTIAWDSEIRKDDNFYTHTSASDEITINEPGWYEISYFLSLRNDLADRSCVHSWVEKNGTDIDNSHSYSYMAYNTYGRYNHSDATFVANLSENDILTVMIIAQGDTSAFGTGANMRVLSTGAWVKIRYLGGDI